MPQIEIDFEVFKELTSRRAAESVTYNDVIRELLKLQPQARRAHAAAAAEPWRVGDTIFPEGAQFRAEHKGVAHCGSVRGGKLELTDGRRFSTPSAAAMCVTGTNVNGWRFWRCKLPGQQQYLLLERLRGKSHL